MRDLVILFIHVISTLARLLGPGGLRSVVAESVLVKHQLLILNRSRQRAPNLLTSDRLVAGLCALLIRPARLIRFRPIMMTTMAALLGALPIALGWGAGGETRKPLGLTVVGGLLFSQLITLYLTPVFYTYMAALQDRLGRRKQRVVLEPVTR